MAVDHLIFNKLKWFNIPENATQMTAGNRNFLAVPTSVTCTKLYNDMWEGSKASDGTTPLPVIGAFYLNSSEYSNTDMTEGLYYVVFNPNERKTHTFQFAKSTDVISAIWGGKLAPYMLG